jgi:pimeloyl-ACP methyl ester carboxylesterase
MLRGGIRRLVRGAMALWALAGASAAAQQAGATKTQMVDVDGHAVRVQFSGLDTRGAGSPVVVLEAGASNALEVWSSVLPLVAAVAPVVAYDRAGLGRSEWDNEVPTPKHVSNRLRRLLERIGAKPPYVLVGYSWGGILTRYFAGDHPGDVAGLVFVDPGPMVTFSLAERLAPFEAIGVGRPGFDAYWSRLGVVFERSPPAVRAEVDVFRGLVQLDSADRDLRPVPDVPVVVLIAAKYLPLPMLQLPFDARAHFEADVRHRIKILQEWALASPRGTLVVSNHSTHAVPREDPDLIVWAIRRVLSAVPKLREE